MPVIRIKKGTLSQLNTAANSNLLQIAEPYFITDTGEIAIGKAPNQYQIFAKKGEFGFSLYSGNFTTTTINVNGNNGTFQVLIRSTTSTSFNVSLSNITAGTLYHFVIANPTGQTGDITVAIPNTSDVASKYSVTIPVQRAIEFSLVFNGTRRFWQISEELVYA